MNYIKLKLRLAIILYNCIKLIIKQLKKKTLDRRPNLSRPYIKLKVYGQTVWRDGGHGHFTGARIETLLDIDAPDAGGRAIPI